MSVAGKLIVFAVVLAISMAADPNDSNSDRDKKEVYGGTGVDSAVYNPYNRYNTAGHNAYDPRYAGYAGYTDPRNPYSADPRYAYNADPRYYNSGAYYDPRYNAGAAGYHGSNYNRYTAGSYTADKYYPGNYDPAYPGYNAYRGAAYTGYPGYNTGAYPGAAAAAAYRKV